MSTLVERLEAICPETMTAEWTGPLKSPAEDAAFLAGARAMKAAALCATAEPLREGEVIHSVREMRERFGMEPEAESPALGIPLRDAGAVDKFADFLATHFEECAEHKGYKPAAQALYRGVAHEIREAARTHPAPAQVDEGVNKLRKYYEVTQNGIGIARMALMMDDAPKAKAALDRMCDEIDAALAAAAKEVDRE